MCLTQRTPAVACCCVVQGVLTDCMCCAVHVPLQPEVPDSSITPTLTQAQIFKLHSRPGATRKIFLDFDGHTTVNAAWNHYNGSKIGIITPPFDTVSNLLAGGGPSNLPQMNVLPPNVPHDVCGQLPAKPPMSRLSAIL